MAPPRPPSFDLEKAVATWRKFHAHRRVFLPDDLDELERHLRDHTARLVEAGLAEEAAFRTASLALGDLDGGEAEYGKVYWGKLRRRHQLKQELLHRLAMLKSYALVALRNARRRPGYSLINVGGLAVGMACCLLIFLYVREELGYDRRHPHHERVFRIAMDIQSEAANRVFANGSAMLAPALMEAYPQVESAVRLLRQNNRLVARGPDRRFYEDDFYYADPSVFDLFALPLSAGDPESALAQPGTVVISARVAARYFGDEPPMGQTITVNDEDFEVSGVLEASPYNSHLTFDFISPLQPLEEQFTGFFQNWHLTVFYTYIRLRENTDAAAFEAEIADFANRFVADFLAQNRTRYRYFLQPIAQIHLHSKLRFEIAPPGNALYIYIFAVVAVLILLIASLNYINLTTAQGAARAREVGVRKVVGSRRGQLVWQFLGESVALVVVALLLGLALVWLALPWFRGFTGYEVGLGDLARPDLLLGIAALLVLTGLTAGFFPALILSSLPPLRILCRRSRQGARGAALRKVLVTGQFTISLILIVGSITAYRQLEFMKNSNRGFDGEQTLVLPVRGVSIADTFEEIEAALLTDPAVRTVTASSTIPGRGADNFAIQLVGEADPMNQSMFYLFTDFNFLSAYDIEIVAGRALQEDITTDRDDAFLINEAGLQAFGWPTPEAALGKRVLTGFGGRGGAIVGVYRDFNFRSLHNEVEPLMIGFIPSRFSYLSLKLDTARLPATLAHVERTWQQFIPQRPFEYFFLDEDYNRQYASDERTALLMLIFAGLAILIACLGLLGLAAFSAQEYTKEIGIRKVLGASVGSIIALLARGFTRLVLVAVLLGTPLAWFLVDRWLDNFAYRMPVEWGIFALAGGAALGIALLTVSYQAVKAALADPVKSLRYE